MPMFRLCGASVTISRSSTRMLPLLGRTKPAIAISSVVLPEPDGLEADDQRGRVGVAGTQAVPHDDGTGRLVVDVGAVRDGGAQSAPGDDDRARPARLRPADPLEDGGVVEPGTREGGDPHLRK